MKKHEINEMMEEIKKSSQFLMESRRGFYCSLCDVELQKYFDTDSKKIVLSNKFCQNLVQNTIEATFLRSSHILPLLQRINTILLCDQNKEFEEDESDTEKIIDNIKYSLDEDDFNEMLHCYNVYNEFSDKPELYMTKCESYCKDYKFTLGSKVFEGSLSKLSFLYDKVLKKKFDMTDPVFAEKDEERSFIDDDGVEQIQFIRKEYDFNEISNVYFPSKYSAENLKSYETVFEEYGIDPIYKASHSKFLFGNSYFLEELKENPYSSQSIMAGLIMSLLGLMFVSWN
jgi:hypothetical protein